MTRKRRPPASPKPAASGELNRLIAAARTAHIDGRLAEAVTHYSQIASLAPKSWVAQNNLGAALKELGRFDEAITAYRAALALGACPEVHSNLGLALSARGLHDEAYEAHQAAVRNLPESSSAHASFGTFFYTVRALDQAARCFQRAIQLNPNDGENYLKLGTVAFESGHLRPAQDLYERAISLAPDHTDAHFHLAVALLAQGNLLQGFTEYEWRRRKTGFPRHGFSQPEWQGEPLAGRTILVYAEQGLGDTLQFVRYAPLLAGMGAQVILLAQPPLVRLLRRSPGISEVASSTADLPPFDYHVPLLSLPHRLGTRIGTIPAEFPYLLPAKTAVEQWAERLAPVEGLKVGLVWAGAPRSHDQEASALDRRRSLRLEDYRPLAAIPRVTFVSLQKGEPAKQVGASLDGMRLVDMTEELVDFADTAALVANLDAVVSVDTSVCHLAGGMGKPVFILSRFDACWRWMRGQEECPWYPTARVFHQPAPGTWAPVIAKTVRAIEEMVGPGTE